MAVPKRKMSRSNTRSRRSQWKAQLTELVTIRVQGREMRVPRRLAKAYHKGLVVED
ncbi:MAG: 50S ribosomal protein L32 [Bowdeniella nasicola]|nr:50S ribosomal protein L32 [Bowdeniella nasicola]